MRVILSLALCASLAGNAFAQDHVPAPEHQFFVPPAPPKEPCYEMFLDSVEALAKEGTPAAERLGAFINSSADLQPEWAGMLKFDASADIYAARHEKLKTKIQDMRNRINGIYGLLISLPMDAKAKELLVKKNEGYLSQLERAAELMQDYVLQDRSHALATERKKPNMIFGAYDAEKGELQANLSDTLSGSVPFYYSGLLKVTPEQAHEIGGKADHFTASVDYVNYPFASETGNVFLGMKKANVFYKDIEVQTYGVFRPLGRYEKMPGYAQWAAHADSLINGKLVPRKLDSLYAMQPVQAANIAFALSDASSVAVSNAASDSASAAASTVVAKDSSSQKSFWTGKNIFRISMLVLSAASLALTSALFLSCAEAPDDSPLNFIEEAGQSSDSDDDLSSGSVAGTSSSSVFAWGSEAPSSPMPFADVTAAQLVSYMKVGWNLGSALETTPWPDEPPSWFPNDIAGMEKVWGTPTVTTKANIDAIKNAGFNTIRIPVSWIKGLRVTDAQYNIRSDWMKRVTEVVNYAAANDIYIILNTHHEDEVFTLMNSNAAAGKAAFKKIWEQIADNFKNYDEKLIFEALNEPRTKGSSAEWNGGTAEERANLNSYYVTFVEVVRNSGGNNGKRILAITPYAASSGEAAMNGLILPTDNVANKLIVNYHNYAPYNFALNTNAAYNTWSASGDNATSITDPINRYYTKFVSRGIPVIIDEFGAMNKNNESARAAWAKYYVEKAWEKGMKCVWWDNALAVAPDANYDYELFGLFNRSNNSITYPTLVNGLMSGTGTPAAPPAPPAPPSEPITIGAWTWEGEGDASNGGTSTVNFTRAGNALAFTGNITLISGEGYGFASWTAEPNAAMLPSLRTASSISFKVKGDGKTYRMQLPTSDIADYCYYEWEFATTAGTETTVTVNLSQFAQPDWGVQKPLNKNAIEKIQWQAHSANIMGAFSITISDLKVE